MVTYYSYTIIAGIHGGPSNDNILFLCYYSWYMEALPMVTYYSYTIIAGIHGGPSNDNILFLCYYSWYTWRPFQW
jgi:hypothetical protein